MIIIKKATDIIVRVSVISAAHISLKKISINTTNLSLTLYIDSLIKCLTLIYLFHVRLLLLL